MISRYASHRGEEGGWWRLIPSAGGGRGPALQQHCNQPISVAGEAGDAACIPPTQRASRPQRAKKITKNHQKLNKIINNKISNGLKFKKSKKQTTFGYKIRNFCAHASYAPLPPAVTFRIVLCNRRYLIFSTTHIIIKQYLSEFIINSIQQHLNFINKQPVSFITVKLVLRQLKAV